MRERFHHFPGALLLTLWFLSVPGAPTRAEEAIPPERPLRLEVRASLAREGKFEKKLPASVRRGGETIELKADLFRPEHPDGTGELKASNSRAAEFRWNVRCSPRALAEGCADEQLAAEGEAIRYKTPDGLKDGQVEITVGHTGDAPAEDAFVTVRVQAERERREAAPGSGRGIHPTRPSPLPQRRRPVDNIEEEKPGRKGGRGGRSGGGSFGPSIRSRSDDGGSKSSGKKSRSRKSDWAAADPGFGDSWGMTFGGGESRSAPRTNARGYNRDNSATVVSCSSLPRPGGGSEVRCEQPAARKELRLRRRAQPREQPRPPVRPVKHQANKARLQIPATPKATPKAKIRSPAPVRSAALTPSISVAPTSRKGR